MEYHAAASDREYNNFSRRLPRGRRDSLTTSYATLSALPTGATGVRGDDRPVIDGQYSRVFDQAENRMHARKALLYLLLA